MTSIQLKLITANNPGSLEKILSTSRGGGFEVSNFIAEFKPERDHYEVRLRVQGEHSQDKLIMQLLKEEDIRSLVPCRR